jgi:hypothetical protein
MVPGVCSTQRQRRLGPDGPARADAEPQPPSSGQIGTARIAAQTGAVLLADQREAGRSAILTAR